MFVLCVGCRLCGFCYFWFVDNHVCARVSWCGVVWYGSVVGGRMGWYLGVGVAKGNIFVGCYFPMGGPMVMCPRKTVFVVCPNGNNVRAVVVLWDCDFWCVVWYAGGWVGRLVVGFVGGWEGLGRVVVQGTMDFVDIHFVLPL